MGVLSCIKFGLALSILYSCQYNSSQVKQGNQPLADSLPINLEQRESFSLPPILDEISGHIFLPGNDSVLYAVQDEQGVLYGYNLNTQRFQDSLVFAGKGDFEGVTTDGNRFYVLKSNGSIYSFSVDGVGNMLDVRVYSDIIGKGEYESLAIDTVNQQLLVLCKSCKADKKSKTSTGYSLHYTSDGSVSFNKSFVIDLDEIAAIGGKPLKTFSPSAMTKRESSGEWFILSSIDKMLLVTDANFKPKFVLPFSRKQYEQPEGLAFDSQDNLYISSERGSNASAMLYKIIK